MLFKQNRIEVNFNFTHARLNSIWTKIQLKPNEHCQTVKKCFEKRRNYLIRTFKIDLCIDETGAGDQHN